MRIVIAPVLVGDRICRVVSPVDSLLEVEEWVGEWWEPSTVTLTMASQAPAATPALLRSRGVPEADWEPSGPPLAAAQLQALLRSEPSQGIRAPTPPASTPRSSEPPRRAYPGNVRFGRRARRHGH